VTIVLSRGNVAELLSVGIGAGEAALLGCALSWAAYTLFGKKLMLSHSPLQPLVLVAYSCVSGSVLLILWMGVSGQALNLSSSIEFWISILYLSVLGTVVAFVWYFEGVHRIGAAQSSVFVFLVPVSALLLGSLILDEPLTLSLLVGGGLIITGVVMVNYTSKRTVSGSVA
jgi:drug/metabolite transporter (DMT)-like permease